MTKQKSARRTLQHETFQAFETYYVKESHPLPWLVLLLRWTQPADTEPNPYTANAQQEPRVLTCVGKTKKEATELLKWMERTKHPFPRNISGACQIRSDYLTARGRADSDKGCHFLDFKTAAPRIAKWHPEPPKAFVFYNC
jgi:hypothetical protein